MKDRLVQQDETTNDTFRILVVDDEPEIRQLLADSLRNGGFEAADAPDGSAAIDAVEHGPVHLVFLDLSMPGFDGVETLRRIKRIDSDIAVVMMTGFGTIETAVEAMKCGAEEFLLKPVRISKTLELARMSERRFRNRIATSTSDRSKSSPREEGRLLTDDPAMHRTMELIERAAPLPSTVLIEGESGTGKELVAREIHERSAGAGKRFVAFNCAVIPEQLLESELFGYERGAFTGAAGRKIGYFEAAQGGTIFLDEIGEMSADLQAKLLRVLQEHTFRRLGGNEEIATDARVIAATNRSLEGETAAGRFRKDLYYRINVIRIEVPPLRKRPQDVVLLSRHFVETFAGEFHKRVSGLEDAVLERFLNYRWEGNVRELRNVIERAMAMTSGPLISLSDLPDEFIHARPHAEVSESFGSYQDAKSRFEADYLTRAMKEADGNVALAARLAGISRQHFYEKLARHNIEQGEFRRGESGDVA